MKTSYYLSVISVLAEKDLKVRYRNSVLGFVWSLLNPLAYMVIVTLVFSLLFRISDTSSYAGWALVGILVWRFFAIGTGQGLTSIVGNASMVTKVSIPRYLIVLSNNVANLIGSTMEFAALLPLLLLLGITLSIRALLLPVLLASEFLIIFGTSLALSSLNVKYRDFYQLWDIALQLGFFLSPIVYNASLIPTRFQLLYSLNPVTRLIESTRLIFLTNQLPSLSDAALIVSSIGILLTLGFLIFRRFEGSFAEEL